MAIGAQIIHRRSLKWRQKILVLYFALTNPATPFYAKLPALFSVVYLISPIDLIPDFIPVAGYLDDLVIVPFLLWISVRLIPKEVMTTSRLKAELHYRKWKLLIMVLLILFLALLVGLFFLIRHLIISL